MRGTHGLGIFGCVKSLTAGQSGKTLSSPAKRGKWEKTIKTAQKTRTLKCRGSQEKQPCSQVSLDQTQINLYTSAERVWCGDHGSTDLQGRHLDS